MCIRPSATRYSVVLFGSLVSDFILFLLLCFTGVQPRPSSQRVLSWKYYTRLTLDFHTNKRIVDDVCYLAFQAHA
jgi:hypothetical protein